MLTISKPLSAGQAQSYHQEEFTAKEQNYWAQSGVIQGQWQGRLAAQFGLGGAVSAEDFAKLSQGQDPQTGKQLVRQRASCHRGRAFVGEGKRRLRRNPRRLPQITFQTWMSLCARRRTQLAAPDRP